MQPSLRQILILSSSESSQEMNPQLMRREVQCHGSFDPGSHLVNLAVAEW